MSYQTTPIDVAPTRRGTPGPEGGLVYGRLAGYTWNGACYCPDCAEDMWIDSPNGPETQIRMDYYPAFECDPNGFGVGILSGFSETDYPGDSCHVCHRRLQVQIIGGPE